MYEKILFPFFNNSRHNFLLTKWWFRAIITFYIILLLISIPLTWFNLVANQYYDCENHVKAYYGEQIVSGKQYDASYWDAMQNCNKMDFVFGWDIQTFIGIFFGILILHYLIQLIFFKVIINYIVLDNKK